MLKIAVVIASDIEWASFLKIYNVIERISYPYGEYCIFVRGEAELNFFHIGWGKISSAAATQYIIDNWKPSSVINIGTCGGIAGRASTGDVIFVTDTTIYDFHVEIGDPLVEMMHYKVCFNHDWLGETLPEAVIRGGILSGDRDLCASDIPHLLENHEALAADWESGAIAFVSSRNVTPCIILRYVSDVVSPEGGEVYGDEMRQFPIRVAAAMVTLLNILPSWVELVVRRLSIVHRTA